MNKPPAEKRSEKQNIEEATQITISSDATLIFSPSQNKHTAELDLGTLQPGKVYHLSFQLQNPTNQAIKYGTIGLQCNCVKFKAKADEIPANGRSIYHMTLNTPQRSERSVVATFVQFHRVDSNDSVIDLKVTYELNNMFNVMKERVNLNLSDLSPLASEKVEVLIVPPTKATDLELIASASIRDFPIELTEENGRHFITVAAALESVPMGGISGEVALRRKGTKDTDGFVLSIARRVSLELNPDQLRFIQAEGRWTAKAVLRSRVSQTERTRQKPQIFLKIGGRDIEPSIHELGSSGVYRVVVDLPIDFTKAGMKLGTTWCITTGDEKLQFDGSALFSE